MLSRDRLITTLKAAAGVLLLLLTFTACRHSNPAPQASAPPPPAAPRVKYSEAHDKEIDQVMTLANSGRWEEARVKADELYARASNDPLVARVHTWVIQFLDISMAGCRRLPAAPTVADQLTYAASSLACWNSGGPAGVELNHDS